MMSDTTDEHIKLANRVRDFITLNGSAYHGFDAPAYAHLLADAIRLAEARALLEFQALGEKWLTEQLDYPTNHEGASAAAAVRCCAKELQRAVEKAQKGDGK